MLISDHLLLNYKRCNRRTFLDRSHIDNIIKKRWLDSTEANLFSYQKPQASRRDWQLNAEQTISLMEQGAEYIFQGILRNLQFPELLL